MARGPTDPNAADQAPETIDVEDNLHENHPPGASKPPKNVHQTRSPAQDHHHHQPQAFPPPQDHHDQPHAFPPPQNQQAHAFPPPQDHHHQPQAFPPQQDHHEDFQKPQAFPPPQSSHQGFHGAQGFQQQTTPQFGNPMMHQTAAPQFATPATPQFGVPFQQALPTEPWQTDLFGCMDDPQNAIVTACFPCVTYGQIAEIIDSGHSSCATAGMMYGCVAFLIAMPCLLSCTYRTKLRARYGLMETPGPDWLVHCFCEWCALCQEYRELQKRGLDPAIGWQGNQARVQMMQLGSMTPPMKQNMMA